jgi:serine/threonine protein kinase
MDTNRFVQLRKIFDEAIVLPASRWPHCVREACGGNESLYAEAMDLLLAHQNGATTASTGAAGPAGCGKMIGPYRILHEIGAGGMGVVYLAVRDDGAFRKNVAVKLLKSNHATADFIQRFHQERQVLANLDHPNIGRILDGGQTADGLPYHVMEYVEGLPLDRFCDTQQLDLADRIRLFQQVVSAVGYLHENLVVHRDLKPSNILVTGEGQVKLLDFGIAKIQTLAPQAPDLTGPANRILTPSYASPEQLGGAPIAKASDIYSLGVILYELLTGRLPYKDATAKLAEDSPLPSANIRDDLQRTPETTAQLRRRIVGDLDQIVLLCLRRNPRYRYASAGALAEDLSRFLDGRSVRARKEPVIERALRFLKRKRVAVADVAVILLALGIGSWQAVAGQMRVRMAEVHEAAVKQMLETLERDNAKPQTPNSGSAVPGSLSQRVSDTRKLRIALENDLAPAWSLRPGLTPERKALLERAARYLSSVRPFVAENSMLAIEVAGAYQEIGTLCEPGYRNFALQAYSSAAQTLEQVSGGDPSHGPQRTQWEFIIGRITSLGGALPAYPPTAPAKPSPKSTPGEGQTTTASDPAPKTEPTPVMPIPIQPVPDPAEVDAVRSSLDAAVSKAKIADEIFVEFKNSLEAKGQALNPDIVSNHTHMQRAIDAARTALEKGDLDAAQMNVRIANEYARRVMSTFGR